MNNAQFTAPKPGGNAPCPCGSGRKIQAVLLAGAQASRSTTAEPDRAPLVQSVLSRFSSLPDDVRQQLDTVARLERQPARVTVPPQQVRSDASRARAAAVFLPQAVALRQAGRLAEAILPLQQAITVKARFIHCRRYAVDTCLSIYCTSLASIRGFAGDRDDFVFFTASTPA